MTTTAGGRATGLVVVNYGSSVLLARNLPRAESLSLSPSLSLSLHVVVVDNFSTAAERESVTELCRERGFELVALPDNRGFGAGCNAGLARAAELGCDSFVLLNPDARIDPATLAELAEHCRRDPSALVSPRLVDSDGTVIFDGSRLFLDTGRIKRLPAPPAGVSTDAVSARVGGDRPARAWLPGTCLALHRDLLERVGGFDEPYFLYWEDIEFSVRCAEAGGSLVIRQDLRVEHDEGGTQDRRDERALSPRYYYWNCRNRLLFAAQHLPRRAVWAWLLATPSESWQILLRGGRRQLIHSPQPLWAALRGSLAGMAIAGRRVLFDRRPEPEIPAVKSASAA